MVNATVQVLFTNDLKKGDVVKLRNGWFGVVYDKAKGTTRMLKVYGYETEIGSVYSHDIVAYFPSMDEAKLKLSGDVPFAAPRIELTHTPAQIKLRAAVR